jgi:hypothetical protein
MRDNDHHHYWIPLPHLTDSPLGHCVKAGLSRFLLELIAHLPALALDAERRDTDISGKFLDVTNRSGARKADLSLLQCMLEIGCNPNAFVEGWETFYLPNFYEAPEGKDDLKA